jgi:C4-type Zn-finger protein
MVGGEKVLDIPFNFNLVEYPFSKPDFMTYIKGFLKKVKETLSTTKPDRVDPFMKGAQEFIKTVVSKFDEYTL